MFINNLLLIEAASAADDVLKKVTAEIKADNLYSLLNSEEYTEEQIEELKAKVQEEMEKMLGPLKYALFDVPLLSQAEDALGDWLGGIYGDDLADYFSNYELPESVSDTFCEN